MIHLIGFRILKDQVNMYGTNQNVRMDINYAYNIFNHLTKQVL